MGICHEFGPVIQADCQHPMQATRPDACTCASCGVVCHGRFAGCADVWAQGPQKVYWRPEVGAEAEGPEGGMTPAPGDQAGQPGLADVVDALRSLASDVEVLRQEVWRQRTLLEQLPETIRADLVPRPASELPRSAAEGGEVHGSLLRRLRGGPGPLEPPY